MQLLTLSKKSSKVHHIKILNIFLNLNFILEKSTKLQKTNKSGCWPEAGLVGVEIKF